MVVPRTAKKWATGSALRVGPGWLTAVAFAWEPD